MSEEETEEEMINKDEIREIAKAKAIEYITVNEATIVLKSLYEIIENKKKNEDEVIENIAKFFIAMKKGLYDTSAWFFKNSLYKYDKTEIKIADIQIVDTRYYPTVTVTLPNKVKLLELYIYPSEEKLLQKDVYEEVTKYKEMLVTLKNKIEKLCKKMQQSNA